MDVYYNPEFIAQGSIIKDLQNADMVLLGGKGKHLDALKELYYLNSVWFQRCQCSHDEHEGC